MPVMVTVAPVASAVPLDGLTPKDRGRLGNPVDLAPAEILNGTLPLLVTSNFCVHWPDAPMPQLKLNGF